MEPARSMNLQGAAVFVIIFFLSCSCVLQATAPFLHIGALVAVTALSWLIAGQFARTEKASEYHSCPSVVVRGWWVAVGVMSPPVGNQEAVLVPSLGSAASGSAVSGRWMLS